MRRGLLGTMLVLLLGARLGAQTGLSGAAVEGVVGLWLAYELNVGPGPATAVLGGAVFALVAVLR